MELSYKRDKCVYLFYIFSFYGINIGLPSHCIVSSGPDRCKFVFAKQLISDISVPSIEYKLIENFKPNLICEFKMTV